MIFAFFVFFFNVQGLHFLALWIILRSVFTLLWRLCVFSRFGFAFFGVCAWGLHVFCFYFHFGFAMSFCVCVLLCAHFVLHSGLYKVAHGRH